MQLTGLASLARHSVAVGRTAAKHFDTGVPGRFKATLAIGGLSDERRAELIAALEAKTGVRARPPVGDGYMRLIGWTTPGYSIQANASAIIGQWSELLHDAGLDPSELLAGDVGLLMEPSDEQPPAEAIREREVSRVGVAIGRMLGQRTRTKIGRAAHGTYVAFGENWDLIAMTRTGERSFAVGMAISGLSELDDERLYSDLQSTFSGGVERDSDGDIYLRAKANRVGTPLGAIALIIRRLASLIEALPAGSSLQMLASELPAGTD